MLSAAVWLMLSSMLTSLRISGGGSFPKPLTAEEERGADIDLTVGYRDDIGRNVRRDILRLRLYYRESCERASAVFAAELCRALEQAAVEVENISRICLATRGTPKEQGNGPVRRGVLAEVIVNYKHIVPRIHKIFGGSGRGEGREVLKRGGIGGCRGDDEGIVHRTGFPKLIRDPDRLGSSLTDRAVDADNAFALLIFYRRECDRGLSRAPVADDKLSLALSDGDH